MYRLVDGCQEGDRGWAWQNRFYRHALFGAVQAAVCEESRHINLRETSLLRVRVFESQAPPRTPQRRARSPFGRGTPTPRRAGPVLREDAPPAKSGSERAALVRVLRLSTPNPPIGWPSDSSRVRRCGGWRRSQVRGTPRSGRLTVKGSLRAGLPCNGVRLRLRLSRENDPVTSADQRHPKPLRHKGNRICGIAQNPRRRFPHRVAPAPWRISAVERKHQLRTTFRPFEHPNSTKPRQ